ncbi:MAG: hypothetical protein IAE82_00880 [Opitutaceae bacterium]|nr:hypothetical protein [Opitutaceae bacterium]
MDTIPLVSDHEWFVQGYMMPALAPTPATARRAKKRFEACLRKACLSSAQLMLVQEQATELLCGSGEGDFPGLRPEFVGYLKSLVRHARQLNGIAKADRLIPPKGEFESLVRIFMKIALEPDATRRSGLVDRAVTHIEEKGLSRREADLAHQRAEERLGIRTRAQDA